MIVSPEEPLSGGQDGLHCLIVSVSLRIPHVILDSLDESVEGLCYRGSGRTQVSEGIIVTTCSLGGKGLMKAFMNWHMSCSGMRMNRSWLRLPLSSTY